MQVAFTRARAVNNVTADLSTRFHWDIKFWQSLCFEMTTRPICLAKLVHRSTSGMGYTDASEQGAGGVWIDANEDSTNFVWRANWPSDIVQQLVRFTNPGGIITNSDLELAALVLHEAVFSSISTSPEWQTPTSGSNNTPEVAWTFPSARPPS